MLIKEEYVKPSLLDKISYLEEQPLSEATIPVTENSRLGKYVVSLEDINSYCEETTSDPGYVISQICDINGIPVDDIAFSVTQESIILQDEVAKNAIYLMNEGAEVLAKPVVHDALYETLEEECQKVVYDDRPIQEISQDFVNKLLKVNYVPDVIEKDGKIEKGPGKEYKGRATRFTVNMAAGKQDRNRSTNILRLSSKDRKLDEKLDDQLDYGRTRLADRGKKWIEEHREDRKKNRAELRRAKKKYEDRLEDRAWNLYNYGDEYAEEFLKNEKDYDMEKGFEEIKQKDPKEVKRLNDEIRDGYRALDGLNLKDELDSMDAQHEMESRLRFEKFEKQAKEDREKEEKRKKDIEEKQKRIKIANAAAIRSGSRGLISKVIARLNVIARKYREKYKNVKVSGLKTAIQKILGFIAKCVASLTAKLHSLHRRFH